MTPEDIADGKCPARGDAVHCAHWWDDDGPCCGCGDDTPSASARIGASDDR